jgi:hypothetical protein
MAESETPSALFRRTSFTIRQRFTPASACSTRIRIVHHASFRRGQGSAVGREGVEEEPGVALREDLPKDAARGRIQDKQPLPP